MENIFKKISNLSDDKKWEQSVSMMGKAGSQSYKKVYILKKTKFVLKSLMLG